MSKLRVIDNRAELTEFEDLEPGDVFRIEGYGGLADGVYLKVYDNGVEPTAVNLHTFEVIIMDLDMQVTPTLGAKLSLDFA